MELAAFALGVKLHADVRGQPPVRAPGAAKRPSVVTFFTEKVILVPATIEFDITTRSERRCGYRRGQRLDRHVGGRSGLHNAKAERRSQQTYDFVTHVPNL